jgi:hypothetical protein
MQSLKVLLTIALAVPAALAQEPSRPRIADISSMPSDSVKTTGSCKASTSGYLLNKHGKKMSESEIGKYLVSGLRDGYVITVYPETENGVFVDMKCVAINSSGLSHP